jgi:hypothetical integral membrane protein (TIGR02206 family)
MPSWLTDFAPFTPVHAVVLVVAALVTIVLVRRRRALEGTPGAGRMDRVLAYVGLANWVLYQGYGVYRVIDAWGTPDAGKYTIEYALPLQICDIASLLAPLMWLTPPVRRRRWISVLVYFWGLGLSSQAFITPIVRSGPATLEFWFFFIAHWMIVGGALYETFGRGFRPTWRDFRFATIVSLGYFAVVFPLDLLTGYNIGFLGEPDAADPKTLVDALGPWPLRTVWIAVIGIVAMAVAMVPWSLVRGAQPHAGPAAKDEGA